MQLSQNELKEIWARSDEYFQFTFDEYKSFGNRLKKWRELNGLSQTDMAEAIYNFRFHLGLENNDVSDEVIEEYKGPAKYKPIDYEIETKRKKKKDRRVLSIMRTYHKWETKESDSFSPDTPVSMINLYILKQLLFCDYEFLFGEIDFPHKNTKELANLTGLNYSTIEKLSCYDKTYCGEENSSISASYAHGILTTLDKLISDDDLMAYLSWYVCNLDTDTDDSYVTLVRPVAGIPTEDAYMDGSDDTIDSDRLYQIYKFTLAYKLCQLRNRLLGSENIESFTKETFENDIAEVEDSFGDRLRKLREHRKYTQYRVRDLIIDYYIKHNMRQAPATEKNKDALDASVLRTYQNWESKKNMLEGIRISINDLRMLKNIFDCDYEYLFGDINSIKCHSIGLEQSLGLSHKNVEKLNKFSTWALQDKQIDVPFYAGNIIATIDLIVSDNELLSNLAYFFSTMPFYENMIYSSILKPIKIYGLSDPVGDAYNSKLFQNESMELRNIFLPAIFEGFDRLRERHIYNNQ